MRDTSPSDTANPSPETAPETAPVEPRSNLLFFVPRSRFAMDARIAKKTAAADRAHAEPETSIPMRVVGAATPLALTPKKPAL